MDHATDSAAVFHRLADRYREKFMDLTLYDESYREFCALLKSGRARVLDAACGPGNVARFLVSQRAELNLLGIDLAPRMIELAQHAVPAARFAVHDARRLNDLGRRFDGILCAFGLPYFSHADARDFIEASAKILDPGGVLYLSCQLGRPEDSGVQLTSSGDPVFIYYHEETTLTGHLERCGFQVRYRSQLPSPSGAAKQTLDLILIATR